MTERFVCDSCCKVRDISGHNNRYSAWRELNMIYGWQWTNKLYCHNCIPTLYVNWNIACNKCGCSEYVNAKTIKAAEDLLVQYRGWSNNLFCETCAQPVPVSTPQPKKYYPVCYCPPQRMGTCAVCRDERAEVGCEECGGHGTVIEHRCEYCSGTGKVRKNNAWL